MDRSTIVHDKLVSRLTTANFPDGDSPSGGLQADEARSIFDAQCVSRVLDIVSRQMQKSGTGFYTIGSSGHEGMAAVAAALQPKDMALLHYRDAAFQLARAIQVTGSDNAWDMLLSFACSSEDPISGGRHKVLGSKALNIPPQTSTIASHLPKAVGIAYAIGLARRRPEYQLLDPDSIVFCSFGDASVNHSTAQGAFNSAGWTATQSVPLPLLFACEDNGIGISTKTPTDWVERSMRARPGIKYFQANGLDIYQTWQVTKQASDYVRKHRKPAFLHIKLVRFYGHAGADLATSYLPLSEVEADEANDPLLHSASLLAEAGAMTSEQALDTYLKTYSRIEQMSADIATQPHISSVKQLKASLLPPKSGRMLALPDNEETRAQVFSRDWQNLEKPQVMSKLINWSLTDLMLAAPQTVLMGEDIGRKGGVYGITQKLQKTFGNDRVVDTLLDEQSILGFAIGLAHNGFIPIPEIQFLAYLHNAEDQLRGEAATLSFFSNGQFANPMVIRIAGLGYQKGFGGHFHNDNSIAVLRDIPGIVLACPSNGADAALMLRECVRLALEEQRIVVFLEPIALYPMRDLHDADDGLWLNSYPALDQEIRFGEIAQHGEGSDLAIISYANGYYLSRQAARELEEKHGVSARVIDLRWLSPISDQALIDAVADCECVLVVDECRRTGSMSTELGMLLANNSNAAVSTITAEDVFIATGPAYALPLPSKQSIVAAALNLIADAT
ncbi:MAG: thiamine pyrophosphate-dependent enzyme [Pseudomonadota bacterium]